MYEALSRKWRPRTFDEIVGQGHVTRALANAISLGKIHHAYLFSGTRGVGKTTFARILSRALNCVNGPTATPCLVCPACMAVEQGSATDVQEIDGASNNGIDDVRQLRENAAYAPAHMRYKIFIIDEVHMLSKQAFNALLKILEEPPPHVVFIFATTEPNKLPDTILSRVQRFDFRMLTEEEILDRFKLMAETEKIVCEEDALRLLARYAFGSMRDGQSIFEQAAVSGSGTITSALVEEILGLVGVDAAIDLVHGFVADGAESALGKFAQLQSRGADLKFLYLSLIDVLRDVAVLAFTGQETLLSRHAPSSLSQMKSLVQLRSREEWMFLLEIAFRSEKDVVATEFPRLGFELMLLRLVNAPALLLAENIGGGERAAASPRPVRESAPASAQSVQGPSSPVSATTTSGPRPVQPSAPAPAASKAPAGKSGDLWEGVKRNLEGHKKVVLVGLLNSLKGHREGDEMLIEGPEALVSLVRDPDKLALLEKAVEEVAGEKLGVRFTSGAEKKNAEPLEQPIVPDGRKLEQQAFEDPGVQEYLREFDGNIIEVKPLSPKEIGLPLTASVVPGAENEESIAGEVDGESEEE